MARNYKELQAKMNPADVVENRQRVREELQRMALDELRNAKQLTQADMAELLNVPQSSISRIEQRTDMYLSTLRNYVQAMGGVLQIQAVFPEGGAIIINRFGDYEDRSTADRRASKEEPTEQEPPKEEPPKEEPPTEQPPIEEPPNKEG